MGNEYPYCANGIIHLDKCHAIITSEYRSSHIVYFLSAGGTINSYVIVQLPEKLQFKIMIDGLDEMHAYMTQLFLIMRNQRSEVK